MNDDEVLSFDENEENTEACDPDPETTESTEEFTDPVLGTSCDEVAEAPSIPDFDVQNSDSDPDPDSPSDPEMSTGSELAELRSQLNTLRDELTRERAFWARLGAECEEFQTLYPETPLSALTDGVWEDVRRGVPIAAAFALAEKRRNHTLALAQKSNLENRQRSSGAIRATESDYFSPNEVRAMSRDEVRQNYQKIMSSMKSWH